MKRGCLRLSKDHADGIFEHRIFGVEREPVVVREFDYSVADFSLRPAGVLSFLDHRLEDFLKR
ncbi:hypothetical protein ASD01_29520 [Ensifer sp. Root423]|uniref:hypothetical protein n=1 Tax=Ensifer sp. Root423 TaxID=1736534 RepID=UPI000713F58B|nr:hypothetical protein [Ensifer sp. Root423]KQX20959.1 hypothetical protein ASD01_29520 [Ensifer sp. Root423]